MWWYWIKLDGEKKKIAYCNPELCAFDNCYNSTCQSRFRIKGATLELTNVRKEDCGLQLQCQIFPKLEGKMASERTAHLYWIKISAVMPKGQSTSLFHRSWVNAYFLMWELRKTKLRKLFYSILLTRVMCLFMSMPLKKTNLVAKLYLAKLVNVTQQNFFRC